MQPNVAMLRPRRAHSSCRLPGAPRLAASKYFRSARDRFFSINQAHFNCPRPRPVRRAMQPFAEIPRNETSVFSEMYFQSGWRLLS
jgi:hypothetical protein